MGEDVPNAAADVVEAGGAKNTQLREQKDPFGRAIHEVGVARIGSDPKKTYLNKYCQSHGIKNRFVMEGSCFVSSGCQNPTLTMMAIVCHCCAHLVDQLKKHEI